MRSFCTHLVAFNNIILVKMNTYQSSHTAEQGKQESSPKKKKNPNDTTHSSSPKPLTTEFTFQAHMSDRIHALVTNPECANQEPK